MAMTIGSCASVVEAFARQLDLAAEKEPERKRRQGILNQMFDGDTVLLEEGYSFDDMFRALDEHVSERGVGGMVCRMSENLVSIRGRKRRLL